MSIYRTLIEIRTFRKAKDYGTCLKILSPLFEDAVAKKKVDADLVRSLAEIFYLSGQFAKGREVCIRAIKAEPANTRLIGRLAEYLAASGQVVSGLSFIDKALVKAPQDEHLALTKGIILHRHAKDFDAAATYLQDFIAKRNGQPLAGQELRDELNAVLFKIEKRSVPDAKSSELGIWEDIGARRAVSTKDAMSAGYSGLTRK